MKSDKIHDLLLSLDKEERLTPDEVIAAARPKTSPLHKEFDWDIKRAALEHWRAVARTIIRGYRIETVIKEQIFDFNEFVEDLSKPRGMQGYISITRLKSRKEEAAIFVEHELKVAATYAAKAIAYAAVLGMTDKIDSLIKAINKLAKQASLSRAA